MAALSSNDFISQLSLDPFLQVVSNEKDAVFISDKDGVRAIKGLNYELIMLLLDLIAKKNGSSAQNIKRFIHNEKFMNLLHATGLIRQRHLQHRRIHSASHSWIKSLDKNLAKETVLIGGGALASSIHTELLHYGEIAFVKLNSSKPSRKNENQNVAGTSLLTTLRGKKFAIFVMENDPLDEIKELCHKASEADVLLLLVEATGKREISVGPMIPPGAENWLESTFFKSVETEDMPIISRLRRGGQLEDSSLAGRAAAVISEALSDPVLSLLWTKLQIDSEGDTIIALNNHELSRVRSVSKHFSIENFLNPNIKSEPLVTKKISSALQEGKLVSIRDAFRPEFAEAMWKTLNFYEDWNPYEAILPSFHFHHHNIYLKEKYPPSLLSCALIFASAATQNWIEQLSKRKCEDEVVLTASRYMPGDHSLPHNDCSEKRSVAFVWHLTRDWSEKWGGQLVWIPSGEMIPPSFNTLHLFNVSTDSLHFVSVVSPYALGKRLAVNGWWRGTSVNPNRSKRKATESLNKQRTIQSYPAW